MVSPLDPNCESRFHFRADGRVFPVNERDKGARETIQKLRLDCRNLRAERREAINAILNEDIQLTNADIAKLVIRFYQRDKNGYFEPFCIAIIQVLREYSGSRPTAL